MAGQTTVEQADGQYEAPASVFARNFSDCARDMVNLAELQSRLLVIDLKHTIRQLALPAGLAAATLAILLGSTPILLMAIAYGLIEGAGWSHWAAFLVAGAIGLILAGGLAAVSYVLVRRSVTGLERSRKELADNLRWLKETLNSSGRMRHRSQCS